MRVADRAEANRLIAEWQAAEEAKQHTANELAEEREWLSRQEPAEENERAHEELKRRGIDFDAAYDAVNRGDHEKAERFLRALAPPPRKTVAALERQISKALGAPALERRISRAPAVGRAADRGSRPVRRPREHRARRAHSPPGRSDGDPEPPVAAVAGSPVRRLPRPVTAATELQRRPRMLRRGAALRPHRRRAHPRRVPPHRRRQDRGRDDRPPRPRGKTVVSFEARLAEERDRVLRAGVLRAWPLRGSEGYLEAIEALVDAYTAEAFLTEFERRERHLNELCALLRETSPQRILYARKEPSEAAAWAPRRSSSATSRRPSRTP